MNNQQEEIKKNKESLTEKKWPLVVLSILILFTLVFLIYFYFNTKPDSEVDIVYRDDVTDQETSLEGTIYLTLSPGEENNPNIYTLDLSTGEFSPVFETLVESGAQLNYMSKFSSDLRQKVFYRWSVETLIDQDKAAEFGEVDLTEEMYEELLISHEEYGNLFILDMETEELSELIPRSDLGIRNPHFSSDGQYVVYWTEEPGLQEEFSIPESHGIYISSLDGTQEEITQGAFPQFSPSGESLVFLGSEGLYTIDLESRERILILDTVFEDLEDPFVQPEEYAVPPVWSSIRFNYSPVNNLLVVTDTLSQRGRFYEIESWDPLNLDLVYDIELYSPNWPVFSPCGNYLVLQEYEPTQRRHSQVAIYELGSFERLKAFDLLGYNLEAIWITDWIID